MNAFIQIFIGLCSVGVASFFFYLLGRGHSDGSGISKSDGQPGSARDLKRESEEIDRRAEANQQRTEDLERRGSDLVEREERDNREAADIIKDTREILEEAHRRG